MKWPRQFVYALRRVHPWLGAAGRLGPSRRPESGAGRARGRRGAPSPGVRGGLGQAQQVGRGLHPLRPAAGRPVHRAERPGARADSLRLQRAAVPDRGRTGLVELGSLRRHGQGRRRASQHWSRAVGSRAADDAEPAGRPIQAEGPPRNQGDAHLRAGAGAQRRPARQADRAVDDRLRRHARPRGRPGRGGPGGPGGPPPAPPQPGERPQCGMFMGIGSVGAGDVPIAAAGAASVGARAAHRRGQDRADRPLLASTSSSRPTRCRRPARRRPACSCRRSIPTARRSSPRCRSSSV